MDRSWEHKAACTGLDPAIFFPVNDEEAEEAKSICGQCDVSEMCLEYAIEHRERNGVWGGATEAERTRIIRRRRRLRALAAS